MKTSELEDADLYRADESGARPVRLAPGLLRSLPAALSWLGLGLSLLLLFVRLSEADWGALDLWISSDTLYPVNVFTDVFSDGFKISGWRFSIAPCWFPDLLATGMFFALTHNVILATLAAGFIQVVAIALLGRAFGTALGLARPGASEPMLLLVLVAITISVALAPGVTEPGLYKLFLPQTHVGTLCAALATLAVALGITRREEERRATGWVAVAAYLMLCALGAMSNLLFVANVLGPLTVVVAIFVPLRLLRRRTGGLLLLGWPAAVIGVVLNRILFRTTDLGAQSEVSLTRISTAFEVFANGFVSRLASGDWLHLGAVLWVFVCLGFVFVSMRSAMKQRSTGSQGSPALVAMLFLCLVLSGAAPCAAIILGGSSGLSLSRDYAWSMHYLHATFLLPLFGLPVVAGWSLERVKPRTFDVLRMVCAVTACILPLAVLARTRVPSIPIQARVPPLTQFMDDLASREHLKYGFAGYWQARPITLLSKTGLRAYPLDGAMKPLLWVSNAQWYEQLRSADGRGFKIDFVILDDPAWKLTREGAVSAFGVPRREVRFENTRILVYGGQ